MLPDILGQNVKEGLDILLKYGVDSDNIIVSEYLSPKADIIGNDRRIIKVSECRGRIILTVSYF
jgi:hypothetical protein